MGDPERSRAFAVSLTVAFLASPKDREFAIAEAFCKGVQAHGDKSSVMLTADYAGPQGETDVAVFVGVKGWSRLIMETHLEAGKHSIVLDKGYVGGPKGPRSKYIRCSVDEFQPLSYFQAISRPDDRLNQLGVQIQPWKKKGNEVVICGGSLKYAAWHRMPGANDRDPATTWATKTFGKLRKYTDRPIHYSPKPSWKHAVPIEGMRFVWPPVPINEQLKTAWAVVSYGSNATVDAQIAGVPTFVLGDGIAKPMSLDDLTRIDKPYYPTDAQRWQWLADLSYAQFSLQEFESGLAWSILRPQVISNARVRGYERS